VVCCVGWMARAVRAVVVDERVNVSVAVDAATRRGGETRVEGEGSGGGGRSQRKVVSCLILGRRSVIL
jgi:hypothetical protein